MKNGFDLYNYKNKIEKAIVRVKESSITKKNKSLIFEFIDYCKLENYLNRQEIIRIMKLILIRHGESIANVQEAHSTFEDPLTEEGKSFVSKIKINKNFEKIYSSDMPRALDTAKLIFPNQEIILESRIQEKSNGIFDGMLKKDSDWSEVNKAPFMKRKAEGGESLEDVRKRVISFLSELEDKTYVLVSHGTIMRIIISIALRVDLEKVLRTMQIGNGAVLEVIIDKDNLEKIKI